MGVYGFVTDSDTGESVLANNPDLRTDAGQFAMIETVTPQDKTVVFDFVAAIPRDKVSSCAGWDLEMEPGDGNLIFVLLKKEHYAVREWYRPSDLWEFASD